MEHSPGSGLSPTRNIYGLGIDEIIMRNSADKPRFLKQDRLGSTSVVLDDYGQVEEQYRYDAFGTPEVRSGPAAGNPSGAHRPAGTLINNHYLFTGREWVQRYGFYEYRARAYHPGIGRFMSEDPIGFRAGDMNLFRYCGGDPVNSTDASGLIKEEEKPKPPDTAGRRVNQGADRPWWISDGRYTPTGSHIPIAPGKDLRSAVNFPPGFTSSNGYGSVSGNAYAPGFGPGGFGPRRTGSATGQPISGDRETGGSRGELSDMGNEARDWLREHYPELNPNTSSIIEKSIKDPRTLAYYNIYTGDIVIDPYKHSSVANYIESLAHELMHAQDTFWNNFLMSWGGLQGRHDFISYRSRLIYNEFLTDIGP